MKKLCTLLGAISLSLLASAEITGNGYYRVHNVGSDRYIYVLDDKGSLNMQAQTAELGALQLWKDIDKTISDPATIIHVIDLDGKQRDFDFQSQGTGVAKILNHAVSVIKVGSNPIVYRIFGRDSGITKYIQDGTKNSKDRGYLTSQGEKASDYMNWYFDEVKSTTDNYFGLTPEVELNGEYYATFFAEFPFTPASAGLKVYYVSQTSNHILALKEITGTVPAKTPVVVKCNSENPADNKIELGGSASAISGNCLKGVYFDNPGERNGMHKNVTPWDKRYMRILGVTEKGKLGFVTAELENIPRNRAYLPVTAAHHLEIQALPEAEYFAGVDDKIADVANGLEFKVSGRTLTVGGGHAVQVYNIAGNEIYSGSDAEIQLPAPGIYFIRQGHHTAKFLCH